VTTVCDSVHPLIGERMGSNLADTSYLKFASSAWPFVGLRPFQYGDHEYFFGREKELDALEPQVTPATLRCHCRQFWGREILFDQRRPASEA
jgi:hypothetical protein